jgi:hypothetical protein
MTTPGWKHTATRLVIKMVERRDLSTVTLLEPNIQAILAQVAFCLLYS